jgi:hypothetical protein
MFDYRPFYYSFQIAKGIFHFLLDQKTKQKNQGCIEKLSSKLHSA